MNEFHKKLVDLYASGELTEELTDEMEQAAMSDPALAHEMFTLRTTVEALQSSPVPEMTEESDYRILLKMQIQGAEVRRRLVAREPHGLESAGPPVDAAPTREVAMRVLRGFPPALTALQRHEER